MANTLTITAVNVGIDDQILYDGTMANTLNLIVSQAGSPLASATLTGTLQDAGMQTAGTVVVKDKTSLQGHVGVRITPTKTGKLTLTLNTATDSGTLATTSIIFEPARLNYTPPILTNPGAVTATATIKDSAGQSIGGIQLNWKETDGATYFTATKSTSDPATPATYQITSAALTPADLTALEGNPIHLQLALGDPSTGVIYNNLVPTSPPLDPPAIQGANGNPPVIDDNLVQACTDNDDPTQSVFLFQINPIENAVANDYLQMFANTDNSVTAAGATALRQYRIQAGDVGEPFWISVPIDAVAFTQNGPLYIYYTVHRTKNHNIAASETEEVMVQRTQIPAPPDGRPSPSLNMPLVTPPVYAVDNYENGDNVAATIPFAGTYMPTAGDRITAVIYLVGYTLVNFNAIKRITQAYTLQATDFDQNGNYIPVSINFTPDQLAAIDGSNGQVYFLVEPAAGGAKLRSPSRNIIVDTVPAYSGSYVKMAMA